MIRLPRRFPRSSILLAIGAFAAVTVPRMAQPGMFIDGVTYAVLARNLAAGAGSFWSPFYTATVYPTFHEQPPLGFGLEAAAFAIAGDHLAVERVFSLLMGILTALLMVAIWRRTLGDTAHDWLPIVFWLLPSTVTWSIVNNMLENTQAVFTTAAVLVFLRSLDAGSRGWAWGAAGGALVAGAVLVKGPNGFFPLAAPAIALVLVRTRRAEATRNGLVMLGATALCAAAILALEGPRTAVWAYWNQHVLGALSGERGGARGAAFLALVRHLAGGIVLRMGILLILIATIGVWRGIRPRMDRRVGRWSAFFLLLGFAGSVPVLASTKIAGHYLVPSIPFYALGCAALALSVVEELQRRYATPKATTALGVAGMMLLVLALAVPLSGLRVEPRDVEWIAEYRTVGSAMSAGQTIGTCGAVANDWGLHAHMQRLFRISLDVNAPERYRYYLQLTDRECEAPQSCRTAAATRRLNLWECRPEER
jgi:4-amino-4-deoxy-L-arabinose transferase-like glycosyltransferase